MLLFLLLASPASLPYSPSFDLTSLQAWRAAAPDRQARDGFTPEQRFFIGYAQWACGQTRPETLRVRAKTDPHSPLKYRINGVVVNMPDFAEAFACKPSQP